MTASPWAAAALVCLHLGAVGALLPRSAAKTSNHT